jgi:thiamine biosynthesis lipoprotein
MTDPHELSRSFRAMNTDVEAVVVTEAGRDAEAECALADVEALFHETEATLSRFLPESGLSALNAAGGRPFRASEWLFAVVSDAVSAARATAGLFDPTILRALVAAGYDRSFELLPEDRAGIPSPPGRLFTWQDIELQPATRTILLPRGCQLDLGGIGKGWTLDRVAERLSGFRDFAVDAGGDLVLSGRQLVGSPWTVGVQDPLAPSRDLCQLQLSDCAVATSTVARRCWLRGGRVQHHLIDPRRGLPSRSGALAATVIAGSAVRAETLAKAALLLGPGAGVRFLNEQPDARGLVVLDGGYVQRTKSVPAGPELPRVA